MAKQRRKKKKKGIGAYDKGTQNPAYAYEDNPNINEIQKEGLEAYKGGDIVADYTGTANPTRKQKRLAFKQMKAEGFTGKSVRKLKKAHRKYDKTAASGSDAFATGEILRAGEEAMDQRNKAIDERSGKETSYKKGLRKQKKIDRISGKLSDIEQNQQGSSQKKIDDKQAKTDRIRSKFTKKYGKDFQNENSPNYNPEARKLYNEKIKKKVNKTTKKDEERDLTGDNVNIVKDPASGYMPDEGGAVNKIIEKGKELFQKGKENFSDIYNKAIEGVKDDNIKAIIQKAIEMGFKPFGTPEERKAYEDFVGGQEEETNKEIKKQGEVLADKMNKDSGVKTPTVERDLTADQITQMAKKSSGLAIEKLGLSDYYPQANRSVGVGTFTGSRIGSQTIYSGAGVLAPMGILDARKRALQKQTSDKIASLDGIKNSLGSAAAQFSDQFNNEGMKMINGFMKKHNFDPLKIMNDTEFRQKLKKYNDFARDSKDITEEVMKSYELSKPNDKGEVAAHYSPGQLKEMEDFLTNANSPDFMQKVLDGKINITDIRKSIVGKADLIEHFDKKWASMVSEGNRNETVYDFRIADGLNEEQFKEAVDIIQEVKTNKRGTQDLFRSAKMKYFTWANEESIRTMVTNAAKNLNIPMNSKYNKDYVQNTIDYLMAKIPDKSFIQNFQKIGNYDQEMYKQYQMNKRQEKEFKNSKDKSLASYSNYMTAQDLIKENFSGTHFTDVPHAKAESYTDHNRIGAYGYINGDQKTYKFYTLSELESHQTAATGTNITKFTSLTEKQARQKKKIGTNYDLSDNSKNPFNQDDGSPYASVSFKRDVLKTRVPQMNKKGKGKTVHQNYSGTVVGFATNDKGEEVETRFPIQFEDEGLDIITNGVPNQGKIANIRNAGYGTDKAGGIHRDVEGE